jgi:hypothetical protein
VGLILSDKIRKKIVVILKISAHGLKIVHQGIRACQSQNTQFMFLHRLLPNENSYKAESIQHQEAAKDV